MDSVKPAEMAAAMSASGVARAELPIRDMMVRGMMAGALLGIATSLAITGAVQTGVPFAGAPVSFEQWWAWNQIPVTLGNFAGGVLFISLAWYLTYRPKAEAASAPARPEPTPAAAAMAVR